MFVEKYEEYKGKLSMVHMEKRHSFYDIQAFH
jgi:hypothetical protein